MEIVGEKINTTRKSVRKAVQERDTAFIQDLARKQFEAGATYLDVNSGMALYPEEEAEDFAWLVPTIQKVVDVPLCIDSGRKEAIETALKLHKGSAMINSVNGDPESMDMVFPLAKEYECKVIALTSSREGKIPATSAERLTIAEKIGSQAQNHGISLENIYFDALVMPISTAHNNALVFLETLQEIKQTFNTAKTISGLSNISFGLPNRKLLNHVFLVLGLGFGMDAAILDPTDKNIMAMVLATETMLGKDAYCTQYIQAYKDGRLEI
ncbi:MAG: methyltetrahydrofolate cobalamin methyltransferase [Desulfobacterales bacterium]|nr:methyltetrahydrofolate cobalamin methyltransferase [Desulfobacterales bacterium]